MFEENKITPDNLGKGALPDLQDFRDYDYERIAEVFGAPTVDWNMGYEVPEVANIKVEDQDGSSSCVGQGFAKYAEVLERAENKNFTDLSSKFIYSQIFVSFGGGSYLRDGAKLVVNQGVAHEEHLPSYPATEEHMTRSVDITDEIRQHATAYKSKSYASIWHKNNMDTFAQAILQNKGCITGVYGTNTGWTVSGGFVKPPTASDTKPWGHAFYCVGYKMIEGKRYIKFLNSWGTGWGENGYGYLGEDYFTSSNIFSCWTLVDLPNPVGEHSMKLVILGGEQYLRDKNGLDFHIVNPYTLKKLLATGIIENEIPEAVDSINSSGNELAVLKQDE